MTMNIQKITFGSGCFWCTEAIFQTDKGVKSATSGYMGGHVENPTYEQVCTGNTGHAEVVEIQYDAEQVSFDELLLIFFKTHDATTLNRQGNDIGTQYRSAIYYYTDEQKQAAEAMVKRLTDEKVYNDPIVTEITPASEFYRAEDYHQEYFARVGDQNPYCQVVIAPKLRKFRKSYAERLKR